MSAESSIPVCLSIAGSDSGGGAGLQADLKAFTALDVFGTTAVTCVTAQNPEGVAGVEALRPEMVALQIRTVCESFPVAAIKTGMLFSSEIICAVAESLNACAVAHLVVDPVMVATSGGRLLEDDACAVLQRELLPRATVMTPNIPEAEVLCGHAITDLDHQKECAVMLARRYSSACVIKGGHLSDPDQASTADIVDVLSVDGEVYAFAAPRVRADETHGTGCTFAAALTALLARGHVVTDAVRRAQGYVGEALRQAPHAGPHRPLASVRSIPE